MTGRAVPNHHHNCCTAAQMDKPVWGRSLIYLSPNPPLTKGRRAQLGMTPAGGGSFRPYNRPPPSAKSRGPRPTPPHPPASLSAGITPSSMLGCAAQSDTTQPKLCPCGGMLAPRRFTAGSSAHKCGASNCGIGFDFKKAPFHQCSNCLGVLCPSCRLSRPKHAGTLPDEYVTAWLQPVPPSSLRPVLHSSPQLCPTLPFRHP